MDDKEYIRVVYFDSPRKEKNVESWNLDGELDKYRTGHSKQYTKAIFTKVGVTMINIVCPCLVNDETHVAFAYCITSYGGKSRHKMVRGETVCFILFGVVQTIQKNRILLCWKKFKFDL